MHRTLLLLALSLISSLADPSTTCQHASTRQRLNAMDAAAPPPVVRRGPPSAVFTSVNLTPQQIASIDAGHPVARVLPWGGPSELYLFGAVHVDAAPDGYLAMSRDIARLKSTKGYLGAGELGNPASVADLSGLTMDPNDITALKSCHEGSCDVQLPAASIDKFHAASTSLDADDVNALARTMLVELLRAYRHGGNAELGEYRDKEHSSRVAEQFDTMIDRASALTNMLPDLRRYLLEYPDAALPGADSIFYWEKVAFGLKPTIRLNHAIIYRGRASDRAFGAVAIKQLYASHYFHTALDLSVCVDDGAAAAPHGFYLVTLKASEQDGLTGVKGSVVRKTVTDKTRSALERALASIKQTLEQPARR